ncbi:MAG: mechanosensitive ion channel family protein [Candidatus Endonucleobacter sp. (ex Gigantidas childressi)]|nr:mechanosensitive ion channel family protein [Candidatus Endonucleobacter sp. (ex Gigantidas childressi)]
MNTSRLKLKTIRFTIILVYTIISSVSADNTHTDDTTDPIHMLEHQVAETNKELAEIVRSEAKSTTKHKSVLHFQMLSKNEEIRELIDQAINSGVYDRTFIVKQINQQLTFNTVEIKYLTDQTMKLSSDIESANKEDKFSILNDFSNTTTLLNKMYKDQHQNTSWSDELNMSQSKARLIINKRNINSRIKQLTFNVEYLQQQLRANKKQLSIAPELEKAAIQLQLLITQRKIEITTSSLHLVIPLAEEIGLPTTEHKRLYFEATGRITQDLLHPDVFFSVINSWSNTAWDWLLEKAPQLIFQFIIFFLILLATKKTTILTRHIVKRLAAHNKLTLTLLTQDFFISMSGKVIWLIGTLIALSQLGINLTPILTGFGIAGVIIGFALQDTLSNFAAGIMLLIYKPFDVSDLVVAGSVEGRVNNMSLVNTTIKTIDNQFIIVPNGKIWGDVIKNVTHEKVRRIDMVFGVSYSDDIEFVEKILADIISSHPSVLSTPAPIIKLHVLNSSSLDFAVRPWVKTQNYWEVYWDVTREVKIRFDKEGISIPFPQRDVHLHPSSLKA